MARNPGYYENMPGELRFDGLTLYQHSQLRKIKRRLLSVKKKCEKTVAGLLAEEQAILAQREISMDDNDQYGVPITSEDLNSGRVKIIEGKKEFIMYEENRRLSELPRDENLAEFRKEWNSALLRDRIVMFLLDCLPDTFTLKELDTLATALNDSVLGFIKLRNGSKSESTP